MTFLSRAVCCTYKGKKAVDTSSQGAKPSIDIVDLGRGIVWVCAPLDEEYRPSSEVVRKIVEALRITSNSCPSASDVMNALLHLEERKESPHVHVLIPESSPDQYDWDGDGLYSMKKFQKVGLPTLGQIVAHVRTIDETASNYRLTIHLLSPQNRACGALLAGAVLVLSNGLSAELAWKQIMSRCSISSEDVASCWDRFLRPFSKSRKKSDTSLSVIDCLEALEFAEQNGWLGTGGYNSFDIDSWQQLRKVADASWVIPGKILAMAHPLITTKNPMFKSTTIDALFQYDRCSGAARHENVSTSVFNVSSSEVPVLTRKQEAKDPSKLSACSGNGCETTGWSRQTTTYSELVASSEDSIDIDALTTRLRTESNDSNDNSALCTKSSQRNNLSAAPSLASAYVIPEQQLSNLSLLMSHVHHDGIGTVFQVSHDFECTGHKEYKDILVNAGLQFESFSFEDGGVPSTDVSLAFVEACREQMKNGRDQCIVHCRGGLGRTSVMIGAYAVATYGISGTAYHGWVRMCRPGSVQTELQEAYLRQLRPNKKRIPTSVKAK
eukprot:TRINITY_DN29488_c0_g2_i1.p1 TRINITY_DN29488_c0_g2~~TRINITY_DN29488_c0_g2_i1.p1  ORF type:complete len:553 (-),score=35.21 TRINITY_DN29488_c0_g2_i1:313-1971(-)